MSEAGLAEHVARLEQLAAALQREGLDPDQAARLVQEAADAAARAAEAVERAAR